MNQSMSKTNIGFHDPQLAEQMMSGQSARLTAKVSSFNRFENQTGSSLEDVSERNEMSLRQSRSTVLPPKKDSQISKKFHVKTNYKLSLLTANRHQQVGWQYFNTQQRMAANMNSTSSSLERHEQKLKTQAKEVYKNQLV